MKKQAMHRFWFWSVEGVFLLLAGGCATIGGPSPYAALIGQGFQSMQQGKWDDVIAVNSRVIQEDTNAADPSLWQAYNNRGLAYKNKGLPEKALADFDKGLTLSQDPLLHYNRAVMVFQRGRFSEAAADADGALEFKTGPNFNDALLIQASSLAFLKEYQKSLEVFNRYTQLGLEVPPNTPYQFAQGMALSHAGELDQARAIANKLIHGQPWRETEFNRDSLLGLFDIDARRKAQEEALIKGRLAESNRDWPAAFRDLERARSQELGYFLDDVPDRRELRNEILKVCTKLTPPPPLPESARRYKIQAVAALKSDATAQGAVAFNYFLDSPMTFSDAPNKWPYTMASIKYGMVNSIAPCDADAYYNIALLQAKLDNYIGAVNYMKAYLQLRPDAPDVRATQDKVYEWEGKTQ